MKRFMLVVGRRAGLPLAALLMLSSLGAAAGQSKSAPYDPVQSKSIGSKSAPIVMEVFSDYQCPSCRTLYEQTLRPLINDYVADGKVYLVHRDFPLPMHKYSREAALWANAAARIGKFQEVDAALYANQASWSTDGNIEKFVAQVLTPTEMKRVERLMEGCRDEATNVKPVHTSRSMRASHGCLLDAAIDRDVALGRQVPVQATPTFIFIYKGQRYPPASGVVSYTILRQFLDDLLRR